MREPLVADDDDEDGGGGDERPMRKSLRDWRLALRRPTAYRVGNGTVRVQTRFVAAVSALGVVLLLLLYHAAPPDRLAAGRRRAYNATYPLTAPVRAPGGGPVSFRIAVVADLDVESRVKDAPDSWRSYLKRGRLDYGDGAVAVAWDPGPPLALASGYALKGRGMELSELVVFDGRLLAFDDRSGMVYEVADDRVYPWIVLVDGDGRSAKGFKSEWATVKDETLYVGSMGKEWTTPGGRFESYDPMWIKAIDASGEVRHIDWVTQYKKVRSAINVEWPGYVIHESCAWSPALERWAFLPRRCSFEPYNETRDEVKGCNYLLMADEGFSDVTVTKVGKPVPTHGFSSFKFVPGTDDRVIVALRTMEYQGSTSTFITAFDVDGRTLMEETFVADMKYEGIEFV